jgi:uncharacterized protein (DUF4415 family)
MNDFIPKNTAEDFRHAATSQPVQIVPKTAVTVELDSDIVAWFKAREQAGGIDWQRDMNGVLQFYVQTTQAMEEAAELDRQNPDFVPR